ncbi:MAG: gp16 family protein [Caulobacteraceae bacterium]
MTAAARYDAGQAQRRLMIAKVKIAQKDLGLDDGDYRAVLQRLTGKTSAADCSQQQLGVVLDHFKAQGWAPRKAGGHSHRQAGKTPFRRPADHPFAKKARAMWISLAQLGVVRDASEHALEAFARRQLKVERMQWADQGLGYKLIEALKAIAERHGWSQDLAGVPPGGQVRVLKERLYLAQERLLSMAAADHDRLGRMTDEQLQFAIEGNAALIIREALHA